MFNKLNTIGFVYCTILIASGVVSFLYARPSFFTFWFIIFLLIVGAMDILIRCYDVSLLVKNSLKD